MKRMGMFWKALLACTWLAVGLGSVGVAHAGAVITNGTVTLGVNDLGALNFGGVGLLFNATGNDSTFPGCTCEGWGVAVASLGITGYNNTASGTSNVTLVSFVFDADSATSVVTIASGGVPVLRVTQDYQPSSLSPNLYEVKVKIENISGGALGAGATDLRYRRVMDWDVEPTPFSEFVTIQGHPAVNLLATTNDGFESADPLNPSTPIFDGAGCTSGDASIPNSNFVDCGAADHGALFDFGFPALAAGGIREFTVFYGACATEAQCDAARVLAAIEVFSYGQCNPAIVTACDKVTGMPNTFLFGFAGVGGRPAPEPAITLLLGAGLTGLSYLRRRRS